jgi:hypothetical protein
MAGQRQVKVRTPEAAGDDDESAVRTLSPKAQAIALDPDEDGKVVWIKKPGPLAQFRLTEALGQAAQNLTYLQMCAPLLYVTKVDDVDVYPPANKREVEAIVELLGESGLDALMKGVQKHFQSKTEDEAREAIRK